MMRNILFAIFLCCLANSARAANLRNCYYPELTWADMLVLEHFGVEAFVQVKGQPELIMGKIATRTSIRDGKKIREVLVGEQVYAVEDLESWVVRDKETEHVSKVLNLAANDRGTERVLILKDQSRITGSIRRKGESVHVYDQRGKLLGEFDPTDVHAIETPVEMQTAAIGSDAVTGVRRRPRAQPSSSENGSRTTGPAPSLPTDEQAVRLNIESASKRNFGGRSLRGAAQLEYNNPGEVPAIFNTIIPIQGADWKKAAALDLDEAGEVIGGTSRIYAFPNSSKKAVRVIKLKEQDAIIAAAVRQVVVGDVLYAAGLPTIRWSAVDSSGAFMRDQFQSGILVGERLNPGYVSLREFKIPTSDEHRALMVEQFGEDVFPGPRKIKGKKQNLPLPLKSDQEKNLTLLVEELEREMAKQNRLIGDYIEEQIGITVSRSEPEEIETPGIAQSSKEPKGPKAPEKQKKKVAVDYARSQPVLEPISDSEYNELKGTHLQKWCIRLSLPYRNGSGGISYQAYGWYFLRVPDY